MLKAGAWLGLLVWVYDPRSGETEVGGLLWVGWPPGLTSEFQASTGYTVRLFQSSFAQGLYCLTFSSSSAWRTLRVCPSRLRFCKSDASCIFKGSLKECSSSFPFAHHSQTHSSPNVPTSRVLGSQLSATTPRVQRVYLLQCGFEMSSEHTLKVWRPVSSEAGHLGGDGITRVKSHQWTHP